MASPSIVRFIVAGCCLIGFVASLRAQGPPSFSHTLVVTASLVEEQERELAASVVVVDSQEIARRQATELHQVLATVPGLAVAQSGSPGHSTSAFMRGTNSNHTLVLWNGVPLNDTFEGRFDLAFLTLDGADRVELVRGPFSALYGSALGGVIHVLTGAPRANAARLRAEAGENGYRRAAVTWNRALSARLRASLAGSGRRGDGEERNDFYDGDDATLRLDGIGAAESAAWGLLTRLNDSDVGIPFDGATPSPRRRTAWRESQIALPLSLARGSWSGAALLSHARSELAFRDPDSFFSPRSDSEGATWRARAVATRRLAGPQARLAGAGWLAGGGEWSREEATYQSDFTAAFGPIDEKRRRNHAVFAQGHGGWGRWSGEAGVRHDDNEHFGSHTSPRLGGVVRLGAGGSGGSGGRLFASYGEAFRAPSFLELYFPFYGNLALEPETSRSAEAGWSWIGAADSGALRLSLVGFDNRIRNLIQGTPPTFLAANVGRARTRGGELGVGLARGRFDARLAATYLETENLDTGADLLRRPEKNASLVLAWAPSRWTLSATGRYVGERSDFDAATFETRTNPSYTRVDLAAALDLGRGVEVSARIENAADERYEDVLGFPSPGRTAIGGLALKF